MAKTKNPFDAREVRSRRGGSKKEPLSRERIVEEALRLLAEDGPEGMSLRKVAGALDTGAASLYAYVDDLPALKALMLDRALGDVDVRAARRAGWRDRTKAVLQSYLRVLLQHRGLAQLALGTIAFGPNAMRILDALLGLLAEGGMERTTAAWAVDLLVLYVTGIAAEQSSGLDPGRKDGPLARALGAASAEEHPHLSAAAGELLAGNGQERFHWAVDVMLDGMLARSRPRARKR